VSDVTDDDTGYAWADPAEHLVGDGPQAIGPLGRGDLLVPLSTDEHHLVADRDRRPPVDLDTILKTLIFA